MSDEKVKVVLCWHMHQPLYRDTSNDQYILPWTYLHAIKDYVDMADHIENSPKIKTVVNFAPILLEQLDDYAQNISQWEKNQSKLRDPLLGALVCDEISKLTKSEKIKLIKSCLKANEERLIDRFPHFAQLAAIAKQILLNETMLDYINEDFISDILVWYHIAWMGETVRKESAFILRLMDKEKGFTLQERRELLVLIGELVGSVIPRYRALAQSGKVELAFSPYAHPIVPLLLDLQSAHDAAPEMPLPSHDKYAGGYERAEWHFRHGKEVFKKYFGFEPQGCWPSEGAVSEDTLKLCSEMGIKWVATGENVLRNSLNHSVTVDDDCIHKTYQYDHASVRCFFRDDGLSDLIGFDYSKWHADDAVSNLIHHLENIAHACPDKKNTVITIVLDGENAWEYYPENAFYFLSALYRSFADHALLETVTFSECVDENLETQKLPRLIAGSWVYGTFSTWIGDNEKNRAWDLLCEAKLACDNVLESGRLSTEEKEAVLHQLAICEGSDWFWWFGDYNPGESVKDFDRLYRQHLTLLYEKMGKPIPPGLGDVISVGGGDPAAGGVMRQGSQ